MLSGFSQPIPASEGLFENKNQSDFNKDSFDITRTWFKDSLAIQELKGYFSFESNDTNIYKGYDVYKYVFYDLRSRKKQDYYSFTDSASIASNYYDTSNSCLYRNIHKASDKFNAKDSLEQMPDTLIGKRNYIRIKYKERNVAEYDYQFEYIYYLSCNSFKSKIIHNNAQIEKLYPGCHVERLDYNSLSPIRISTIAKGKIVRNKLTEEEEKIFEKWEKNATNTTMPIITCLEVIKKYKGPVKLRSDPRFIDYYNR